MATLTVGYANLNPDYEIDGIADEAQINQAIQDANAGDEVLIRSPLIDIKDSIIPKSGVSVNVEQYATTFKQSTVVAAGIVNPNNSGTFIDDIEMFTNGQLVILDCAKFSSGIGIHNRQNSNALFGKVYVKDAVQSHVGIYGCDNITFNYLKTTRSTDTPDPPSASHGVDIDAHGGDGGTSSTNITIEECDLANGDWSAIKTENCNGVTVTNFTMNSFTIIGDEISDDAVDVLFDGGTFDARVVFGTIGAANTAEIKNAVFTRDGGCIVGQQNSGTLEYSSCTFNGRNSVLYWDVVGSAWANYGNIVDAGNNKHPGKLLGAGKTTFASMINTGSPDYNTAPYCTPNMAHSDLKQLCLDVGGVQEDGIRFALRSDLGEQPADSMSSNISFASKDNKVVLEGYPGVVTVDLENITHDFIQTSKMGPGSQIIDFLFDGKGLTTAGINVLRFDKNVDVPAVPIEVSCYNVKIQGMHGGGQGSGVFVDDTSIVNFYGGFFKNFRSNTSHDGYVVYCDNTGTFNMVGTIFQDCIDTSATVRRAIRYVTGSAGSIIGCLFKDNAKVIFGQIAGLKIWGSVFTGNDEDIILTAALTTPIENSIFMDGESNFSISTTEINNSIVVGGYTGSGDTNVLDGTPTFVDEDNNDYTLTSDSIGVAAGAWDEGDYTYFGINGQPYNRYELDMGCSQSDYSALHARKV